MIPILLQQGYKALAVTFDVWGVANMVKDGMGEARKVINKIADDAAAAAAAPAEEGEKKEVVDLNGSKA